MKSFVTGESRWVGGVLALLLAMALCGCRGGSGTAANDGASEAALMGASSQRTAASEAPTSLADRLYAGNRISITFSGVPNAPGIHEEQIRDDGQLTPPLLGHPVAAAGKTVGQLQQELHDLYVPAYFRSLTVTVKLQERYFFVGGQVKNPGMKPYLQQMDVISAVQAGGDFTDFADRRNIKIVRSDGKTEEVNWKSAVKDPKANRPVYPGDRVIVAQRVIW